MLWRKNDAGPLARLAMRYGAARFGMSGVVNPWPGRLREGTLSSSPDPESRASGPPRGKVARAPRCRLSLILGGSAWPAWRARQGWLASAGRSFPGDSERMTAVAVAAGPSNPPSNFSRTQLTIAG